MNLLHQLFGHICGQVNVWTLDGVAIPMCQRCTGLYVGGFYAIVVIAILRLKPSALLLWVHGSAMLLMIPFGYHLLPQCAIIRTITGQLFAYGLTYLLFLNLADQWGWWHERTATTVTAYFVALMSGITMLWFALWRGGKTEAWILSLAGAAGALIYAILVIANLSLFAGIAVVRLHEKRAI